MDVGISRLVMGFLHPVEHKGLSVDVGISKGIFMSCLTQRAVCGCGN